MKPSKIERGILSAVLILVGLSAVAAISVSCYFLIQAAGEDMSTESATSVYSLVVISFTITVALAAIIPYFISTNTIQSEADDAVNRATKEFDQKIISNKINNLRTDAHLSRMVGQRLRDQNICNWSVGWFYRSIKRYNKIIHSKQEYKELVFVCYLNSTKSILKMAQDAKKEKSVCNYIDNFIGPHESGRSLTRALDQNLIEAEEAEENYARLWRACKDTLDVKHQNETGLSEYNYNPSKIFGKDREIVNYYNSVIDLFNKVSIRILMEYSRLYRSGVVVGDRLSDLANDIESQSDNNDVAYKAVKRYYHNTKSNDRGVTFNSELDRIDYFLTKLIDQVRSPAGPFS